MSLLIVTHYFFRPTTNQLKQISMRQTHLKLTIKYQRDLEYRCSITLFLRCLVNFNTSVQCINTLFNLDKCLLQLHRLIQLLNTFFIMSTTSCTSKLFTNKNSASIITLIKQLISKSRTFQVLISRNTKWNFKRILNYLTGLFNLFKFFYSECLQK